eukprot:TRINITY_DN4002_c0_g1_i5.p2 TRINITY_DN4002_c0_g1~~TRINITY_DN4002_c0_g1_i5.p2  ORF type:complete len:321 (+),score=39.67 TRINITY_DN4002_c0_g1_i5:1283-2245(+)
MFREKWRFMCPECRTEFCGKCKRTPYHDHYMCNELELAEQLTGFMKGKRNFTGNGGDTKEICQICLVSELSAKENVALVCGHKFHWKCLKRNVSGRGISSEKTGQINFVNRKCPLCRKKIEIQSQDEAMSPTELEWAEDTPEHTSVKAKEWNELVGWMDEVEAEVKVKMVRYGVSTAEEIRLRDVFEEKLRDNAFYLCYRCKKPYYGGKVDGRCEEVDEVNEQELICGGCADMTGKNTCDIHGNEYIDYKCRYCCQVSVWYCWGTTHFCDTCHKKAAVVITSKKEELPPCTCGGKHPPNGEGEWSLGCGLCRMESCTEKK